MSVAAEVEIPNKAEVKGGCVPYLNLDGALAAAEFYQKAFGATLAARYPPDDKGRSMHVHLYVNGGSLMLSDFYPEHGHAKVAPQGFALTLQVDDIEAWFKRAVAAGAEATMPPQKMFWGDLYGQLRDPFGVSWALTQPVDGAPRRHPGRSAAESRDPGAKERRRAPPLGPASQASGLRAG